MKILYVEDNEDNIYMGMWSRVELHRYHAGLGFR